MRPRHPFLLMMSIAIFAAAPLAAAATAASAPPPHRAAAARPAPASARSTPAASPDTPPSLLAAEARGREDEGAYGRALATLRTLRAHTTPDADLELALALDAVRSGQPDTAWALLNGPLLSAALADSADHMRWHPLGEGRDRTWLDGRFDGWYWTIARARAELALRLHRWDDAVLAARAAVRARPLSGRDHLLLALAAGRAGDAATARAEADRATDLDPLLPEALYLRGLWAWKDGHRIAARADFRAAIARDSTFRPPALALVRVELPSARPDSLPVVFLNGERRACMLVASEGPKVDETLANDQIPGLYGGLPSIALPDSVRRRMALDKPLHLEVTALVGETGRAVAIEFPYLDPRRYPAWIVNQVGLLGLAWRFRPAVRLEHPVPMWINVEVVLNP